MFKTNLKNFSIPIQTYRMNYSNNFSLNRLTATKKQEINNPRTVIQRRGKYYD